MRNLRSKSKESIKTMYGDMKGVDYYCGKCGAYLITTQTHQGIRGERRCNSCNQQVRETARVTKEVVERRRKTGAKP